MRKVIDYVKENRKIIIVVILIVILIGAVYIIDKSKKSSSDASSVFETEKSSTEVKLTGILKSIQGVGDTRVMITENDGKILGVVIVCEGADNIMTRSDILNAVSTALDIDKKIIAIYSMTV